MDSVQNLSAMVFCVIAVSAGSLVMGLLGWMAYAGVFRRRSVTDQSGFDVTVPDELQDESASSVMPESFIPEEEQGMEEKSLVLSVEHGFDEPDVVVPCEDTIIPQSELLPSSEESQPITPNEPSDIPRPTEIIEESLVPTCLDACTQPTSDVVDLPMAENSETQIPHVVMMTHSSNAAKSFQRLLESAMSPAPSESEVTATPTQSVADDSSHIPERTDETTDSVARNQRRKGKNQKKKNKRKGGRNGKN